MSAPRNLFSIIKAPQHIRIDQILHDSYSMKSEARVRQESFHDDKSEITKRPSLKAGGRNRSGG